MLRATVLLSGTMIGAGVLGIPYVVARSGAWIGVIHLAVLTGMILLLNLMIGEAVVRTRKNFELPGLAEHYLGKAGKFAMSIIFFLGAYAAFTAYTIGQGQALSALFGGAPLWWSIGFWAVASALVFLGIKVVARLEVAVVAGIVLLILALVALSIPHAQVAYLTYGDLSQFFLPFGVVLFALGGASAIPPMEELLSRSPLPSPLPTGQAGSPSRGRERVGASSSGLERRLRRAIILGTLLPAALYLLFMFATVAVTGPETTELATVGLGRALGHFAHIAGNLFAALAMTTAFLTIGLAVKRSFIWDFRVPRHLASVFTVLPPFLIFSFGLRDFIETIGLAGALLGGLNGIMLVAIYLRSRNKGEIKPKVLHLSSPRFVAALVTVVFLAGSILGLMELFG